MNKLKKKERKTKCLLKWLVSQQLFVCFAGNCTGGLNVGTRIASGLTTGALAVLLAQPTDVVKVRMQAQQRMLGSGTVPRYKSTLQAYQMIARQEGARGLWKGKPQR